MYLSPELSLGGPSRSPTRLTTASPGVSNRSVAVRLLMLNLAGHGSGLAGPCRGRISAVRPRTRTFVRTVSPLHPLSKSVKDTVNRSPARTRSGTLTIAVSLRKTTTAGSDDHPSQAPAVAASKTANPRNNEDIGPSLPLSSPVGA